MDLGKAGIFNLLTRRMDYVTERQTVLARNVANSDTPNYQPRDLVPFAKIMKQEAQAKQAADQQRAFMQTTNPNHLQSPEQNASFEGKEQKSTYETAPSGNGVILEEQMMKIAENNMDYNMVTNLYKKHVGMIRMAIGRTS